MLDLSKNILVSNEFVWDLMRNKKLGEKIVDEVTKKYIACGRKDCTECPHNRAEFIKIIIDSDIRKEREKIK